MLQIFNQVLTVASELAISAFPAQLCSTTVLKVVPMIFMVMSGFVEYFMELSKTKADFSIKGFSVPVSRIGKEFKVIVEGMIQHIEQVQRTYAEEETKKNKSKKVPNAVKAQLMKDKKLIPNMVYSIEKYDQQIISLSNKKKDQRGTRLLVGMKLSTARDFKIDAGKLTEALSDRRVVQEMTTVPDEETRMKPDDVPVPAPGSRLRKGRKRKPASKDESHEEEED
ncbi:Fanconi anemia group I protein [Orchesella cincta]|uniref:Fanconi anemia group I protein n=1 Tax=Orchesella cincta TaxID=48709 RepID=A0A1D2MIS9_ORCCI|nr:Fanconi anemia group I protein [Orchesella cincta]